MHLFESGRYTVNYQALFFGRLLEYGPIEISDSKGVRSVGTLARLTNHPDNDLQFSLEYSLARKRPAGLFAKQFGKRNDILPIFAWNAGFAHTRETIAKLALDDSFSSSPLGLLAFDSHLVGCPLYNHDILCINREGKLSFRKFSLTEGIRLSCNSREAFIPGSHLNLPPDTPNLPGFCMYDANYQGEMIPGNGRTVIFMGGTTIKEIYRTDMGVHIPYKPSGLVLSIHDDVFPPMWDMREKELEARLPGFEQIVFAVEAGASFRWSSSGQLEYTLSPGWQTLFYPDLNKPKSHLLAGLDADGNILVANLLHIEKEYSGLTFFELPDVLQSLGFVFATMFDDGAGSSLYRGIERIKATEHDADANFNPFSDVPQPGTASSAIIAY